MTGKHTHNLLLRITGFEKHKTCPKPHAILFSFGIGSPGQRNTIIFSHPLQKVLRTYLQTHVSAQLPLYNQLTPLTMKTNGLQWQVDRELTNFLHTISSKIASLLPQHRWEALAWVGRTKKTKTTLRTKCAQESGRTGNIGEGAWRLRR